MPEIYEPSRALIEDWRTFFVDRKDDSFILPCENNIPVELNGRWMLLNIMLTYPLIKYGVPISADRHLHLKGIYDATSHATVTTQVALSLENAGFSRAEFGHDIIMTVQDAHNMCFTHLGPFVKTMDIFGIADTIIQEGVEEHLQIDYGNIDDRNIQRMEKIFQEKSEEVTRLLQSDVPKINVFRAPLLCGALKKNQFHQFALSAGPRTDTNEGMFLRPVVGSFLGGMVDIQDLVLESRSAAKATHYNKTQMPATAYQNRKISIQSSVIASIYLGDCGSDVYITMTPTEKTIKYFSGRFYLDELGVLVEITADRYESLIDKTIKLRDPITCRYTDGYCEVCGGTLTRSFAGLENAGFLANINTGAPVSQQVLSTKHLITTDSSEYEVHEELDDIFLSFRNNIYLRSPIAKRISRIAIGFRREDIAQLNDLRHHADDSSLSAKRFSNIKYINMGQVGEDGIIRKNGSRVPMGGESKTYPHLSPEVLHVIRNHPDDIVEQDKISWFMLRNVNPESPIMQCSVVNRSIKQYVAKFSALITKEVEKFRSANDFMEILTNMIWDRVGAHSTHISCLAKACLITSRKDLHVPVVEDPDNVMFGTLHRNIAMRSIGGLMAFERYNQITNKPATYVTPKYTMVYDPFMGYSDSIEEQMYWPSMEMGITE